MTATLRHSTACLAALLLTTSACATLAHFVPEAAQEPAVHRVQHGRPVPDEAADAWKPAAPTELYDVARVVDGDTIHVLRDGVLEKLRLLSVDTEEKLSGRQFSRTKPETIYGEETALWAREFFDALATEDQPALLFPDGEEARDVYGRLLCHVLLPDGTDFNLQLVLEGRSPYFNKYGNSRLCHEAFVAAQARARRARLGVWDPKTNRAASEDAPSAVRPYDELLPWWEARARAIDDFRRRGDEETLFAAEDPNELARAMDLPGSKGRVIEVFGAVDRTFDEDDGSLTVLFRAQDKHNALRLKIGKKVRKKLADLELESRGWEFRQNFLYVQGGLLRGGKRGGYEMRVKVREQIRLAGPEPSKVEVIEAGVR